MAFPNIQAEIETLYDGVCTVTTAADTIGDDYLTHREQVILYEDVPCRLSHREKVSTQTNEEKGIAETEMSLLLFVPPGTSPPEGSRITVNQYGNVYELECAGTPARYLNHNEIPCEAVKRTVMDG